MKKDKRILLVAVILSILVLVGIWGFSTKYSLSVIRGNSMSPTFNGCTLSLVNKQATGFDIDISDIVIVTDFDENIGYHKIAHRVVSNSIDEQRFSLRGDNNALYDFPSSIDGFFDYNMLDGKIERYWNMPKILCGG